jgi:hypothetical protein
MEVISVQFDLGVGGLSLLILISLVFGVVAQLVLGLATRWLWLLGAAAWFIGGLFASEVVWGTATIEELQPIIDGLLLDESLLGGLILGLPAVLVTWYATRRSGHHRPSTT